MHLISPSIFLVLLTLLNTSAVEAAIFHSKAVQQLTGKTFNKVVKGSDKLTVAAFVAPWCGHCKALAPEYDKAAENLKGLVNVVAVDCDEGDNKPLCGEMGIKGFPTLKIFPGGSAPPQDYNGERKAKAIVTEATSRMPTFVKRATTSSDLLKLKNGQKKPIALLFTSSTTITPLYKALSSDLFRSLDFWAARDSKVGKDVMMEQFGVEKVPSLVVVDGEKVEKYDGPLKYEAIKTFLTPFAKKGAKKAKKSPGVKEEL